MSVEITISLISTLVIAVYLYLRNQYSYWNGKKVKCLPVVPFLGSNYENFKLKKSLFQINDDIYRKHRDDKFVAGYRGLTPELHVFDPDIIRMILVKDFNTFNDRSFPSSDKEPITQNLFGIKGKTWKILRQKMSSTFTSAKMKNMFPLIEENGKGLTNILSQLLKKNDVVNVREIMAKYTTDTIGNCVFGLNMNSMTDENAVFRAQGRRIFEPSWARLPILALSGMMPKVIEFFKLTRFVFIPLGSGVDDFFINITKQIIRDREIKTSNRHDFIDLLMDLKKEEAAGDNPDNFVLTDELMAAQCFIFFSAGFETSSSTMSFALYELARNPDVQIKLQREITEVLEKHGGTLSYDTVHEMIYLKCVIQETLRKYPSLPLLDRICNSTYTIPGTDLTIDKDVNITIPLYSLQNDEKNFPNADKFIPERFLHEIHHPFSYLPFGDGPRNCIGMRFGKLQTSVGLIAILKSYSIETCDKTPKKLQYVPTSIVMQTTADIQLRFKPITSKEN